MLNDSGRSGFGTYQLFIFLVSTMAICCGAAVMYNMAFATMMPKFYCSVNEQWSPCTNTDICKGQRTPQLEYRVDWDSKFSLNNWVGTLDLVCRSRAEIGMFGSYYFAGWALLVLVVPPLSDKYGRWKIATVSMAIQIVVTSCLLMSKSY